MAFDYSVTTSESSGSVRKGLLQIATQVSASIGTEFFESLVKNLAEALKADGVYLGEFTGGQVERLKTLAVFPREGLVSRADYELAGSVAAQVAIGDSCAYTRGVRKKFPSDGLLIEAGAQACIVVPLPDSKRQAIGVLMAMYRRPLTNARFPKSMLETFAPRAAAELHRMQEDAALRESEQRYHAFISLNEDAMWRIEFEAPIATTLTEDEQVERIYQLGYMAECNDSMARLLGRDKAAQLIGIGFSELARKADPRLDEDLRAAIRSGYRFTTVETQPRDEGGARRNLVRSQWGIVENGFLKRIWGTLRDITELRRVEAALRVSEQRLAEVLESVHLLTVILDGDGSITSCNDYLLRLTGWQASDIAGKKWFDLMVPCDERERLQAALTATHENSPAPHCFESTLLGKDGRRWLIGWESTSVRDSEGRVTGFAGVGRDITVYRALEAELRQAQKLESIGRSVGIIAEDFSSLLTVISGYCDLLLQPRQEPGSEYGALLEIKRAAEQGAALTQQLLAFSRQHLANPQMLDLNVVTEEFGRTLQPLLADNVKLTIEPHPSPGLVRADATQIQEMLLHLVANAREAMPEGGNLTISTSNVQLDENRDSLRSGIPPGDYVLLSVADSGVGMSEETRAQLFEPFFSTKEQGKGSGLGLSNVFSIVHQFDGHIVVETAPGAGTTFQIYLPRVQEQAS